MLDLLLAMSSDAILIFNEEGELLRANQRAAEMFNCQLEQLTKQCKLEDILPDRFHKAHKQHISAFLKGDSSSRKMGEFRDLYAKRKNGEEFPVQISIGREILDEKPVMVAFLRDMTIQRETDEFLQSLASFPIENPNPVFRVKENGEILFTNASAKQLLETIGLSNIKYAPEEIMGYIHQTLRDRSQTVALLPFKNRIYSCVFGPVQEKGYVNIYTLDVTQREDEKTRLAISNEILNSIGNLVLVANSKAEIIYVSPSAKQITGYEPEELIGDGWWELQRLSGDDVEAEKEYIRKAASGILESDTNPYEHRILHKDGSWRWLMISDTKGPRDLLIGIGSDITSIKMAEEELERQRDFAQTLTRQMGQGLTVTDEKGRFEYINPSYARMLDYTPEELIGKTPYDLTLIEDHAELMKAHSTRAKGEVTSYETHLRGRDGRVVYALITGVPRMKNGQYKGAITVITDLTERLRMEEQLRKYADEIRQANIQLEDARDRALEASYVKSAFLATMSHEIRTPMNAILGMSELLLETPLNEEQKEFASIIENSTKNLVVILNDILDFSKIEAGKLSIMPKNFSPADLIKDIVKLYSPKAHKKQIDLLYLVTANIPESLVGDAGRIYQVLNNLVSNAIKFTPAGGSIIVNLSGSQIQENLFMATFSVLDGGVGIPESLKPKLFEPFTQADTSHSRKYGGTGLGLAISKRLVDLMHGEIGFVSVEKTGTNFWFSLPLKIKNTKPMVDIESEKKTEKDTRVDYSGHAPILVVEDSLVNRDLFTFQLREFGLQARHVDNGKDAVELLQTDPEGFSMVLMDLNMARMDGITATELIRKNEEKSQTHVTIVAVTANAMQGVKEKCLQAGMDDFINKPVSLDDLEDLLAKWLSK